LTWCTGAGEVIRRIIIAVDVHASTPRATSSLDSLSIPPEYSEYADWKALRVAELGVFWNLEFGFIVPLEPSAIRDSAWGLTSIRLHAPSWLSHGGVTSF
jgi:hypothetical protein